MKRLDLKYDGARVAASLYDARRAEMHAFIYPTKKGADAATQIKALTEGADALAAERGLCPTFMRWLLSDPANQSMHLPEEKVCATSVIGQPPLDGTKAILFVILESDACYSEIDTGIWSDPHGMLRVATPPGIKTATSREMTESYLTALSGLLMSRGATLRDNCLRTWFFIRDIDRNYTGVVEGRNEVFEREGLTPSTRFIASTGIEGKGPDPWRTVLFDAFADTRITPTQILPLYGHTHLSPTYDYGVAFERGTAVDYGDRRHVYISGTASIDNKGQIVAPGDIKAQTLRMMENIGVLLAEAGCGWEDTAHLTVYLRDIADHGTVKETLREYIRTIPTAIVLAPVCRPGWLVEAECMAIKKAEHPEYRDY